MRKAALVEMSVAGMVEGRGNGSCCDLQEGGTVSWVWVALWWW
jgi:hypothetical protein